MVVVIDDEICEDNAVRRDNADEPKRLAMQCNLRYQVNVE